MVNVVIQSSFECRMCTVILSSAIIVQQSLNVQYKSIFIIQCIHVIMSRIGSDQLLLLAEVHIIIDKL